MPQRAKRCRNRRSSSGCWPSMRSTSPSRTCARCLRGCPRHASSPCTAACPSSRWRRSSEFLVAMGYPQERVRNPRDGAFSYSSRIDSRELAGTIAWHYERDGVMPMLIGHSQGGMLAIKVLQDLAGASGAALPVWNPLRGAAEARSTIVDPLRVRRGRWSGCNCPTPRRWPPAARCVCCWASGTCSSACAACPIRCRSSAATSSPGTRSPAPAPTRHATIRTGPAGVRACATSCCPRLMGT